MLIYAKNVYSVIKSNMDDMERAVFLRTVTMPDGKSLARKHKGETIFPTGLIRRIKDSFEEKNLKLDIRDMRVKPSFPIHLERFTWGRDYQREGVKVAFQRTRGIIKYATGAGKGEMAIAFPAAAPEGRWLYTAPRQVLVNDVVSRYVKRTGKTPHEFTGSTAKPGLTVSTTQALARKVKELDPDTIVMLGQFDGYISDEAHTSASPTYSRIGQNMKNAYYRFALSATPLDRSDGKSLSVVGSFGEVITSMDAHELIGMGQLTPMRVQWIPCRHSWESLDWRKVQQFNISQNEYRNKIIAEVVKWHAPKPCIVFAEIKEHAKILAEMLDAELVDGDSKEKERQRVINSAKARETGIIVATRVFAEGVDIPTLNSVFIASGGKSVISLIQRIGRGSRLSDGKTECTIYDLRDYGERYTARHAKERAKTYTREKIPQSDFDLSLLDTHEGDDLMD